MARIPETELEQLKREIDLVALVRSKGVKLEAHGKDLIGCCPFHNDKTPSLVITPEKNLWHCLGACNTGGSVIDWIMKAEGMSFRHAVEVLREGSSFSLVASDKITHKNTVPKLSTPVTLEADDQTALQQVIDYYHETLKSSPNAQKYLTDRGIYSEEAVNTFKIGYADRTLGIRLPHKNRKEGAELRTRLERLGVYRESGHEHFNGSVVFPVIDERGIITEIYGRKIVQNLRTGTAYHTYLPGPHRGLWNSASLSSREIILCESIIDALTFWVNGFRNVTTAYGVNGFTDEMIAAFITHRVNRVYIAFDRDEAGDAAALRVAETLLGEGVEVLRIQFPKNMDANEYARSVNPAGKALLVLINAAVWMGKGSAVFLPPSSEHTEGKTEIPPEPQPVLHEEIAPLSSQPPEKITVPCSIKGEDIEISLGGRSYRIRGLYRNLSYEILKVNIRVLYGESYYIDTIDIYNARHRTSFVNAAEKELGLENDVVKRDVGRVLLKLEELQDAHIQQTLKPEKATVQISDEDRNAALALLKDPNLLDRIVDDVRTCGIVGEGTNALTAYLAAVSRKLDKPLGVIIQSSSAAGKTSLMDAILSFMPSEERIKYSAMTGQSLFYMGETDLKHKILAIVEEEGAEKASYALKLLQSEGEISIASTGKDPTTGKLVTHEYRVEGPVMIFLTTTSADVDEELQNRCIVLSIDEGREQTKAIHKLQREQMTLEGVLASEHRKAVLRLHQNAQRLLQPVKVVNPFAPHLRFLDDRTRTRRDHMKYLTLINCIALLHQYQRPLLHKGTLRYIEATREDITTANVIAREILGRSLDELPPQTRRLLHLLHLFVKGQSEIENMRPDDYRFNRRDVREFTNWTDFQVQTHLSRLVSLEYVIAHRGMRGQLFVYELLYDSACLEGKHHLPGIIEVEKLEKYTYDTKFEVVKPEFEGVYREVRAPN